jgi:hypothetical protein
MPPQQGIVSELVDRLLGLAQRIGSHASTVAGRVDPAVGVSPGMSDGRLPLDESAGWGLCECRGFTPFSPRGARRAHPQCWSARRDRVPTRSRMNHVLGDSSLGPRGEPAPRPPEFGTHLRHARELREVPDELLDLVGRMSGHDERENCRRIDNRHRAGHAHERNRNRVRDVVLKRPSGTLDVDGRAAIETECNATHLGPVE